MTDQAELFDLDQEALDMIEHLGDLSANEVKHRWPRRLAELVDVTTAVLQRLKRPPEQARDEAAAIIIAIAHYLGGRMLYLPTDEKLRLALRDRRIWQERDDYSAAELAERYSLTQVMVHKILREQRALYIRRVQQRLFDDQA